MMSVGSISFGCSPQIINQNYFIMKKKNKLLIVFSIIGLLTFATPQIANSCQTAGLKCPNGSTHIINYCDNTELMAWWTILCLQNPV